jgi:hypothetical protein
MKSVSNRTSAKILGLNIAHPWGISTKENPTSQISVRLKQAYINKSAGIVSYSEEEISNKWM